ncbi:MAG TPA: response regulator [Oceanobacillus sp.]|nr:response regulator [Oceanobacillus sp.]
MIQPYGLVVEDDTDLVRIFSHALQTAGFETDTCQSGSEALAKLEQAPPRVLVLDLHLPEVSGVDILKHMKADGRYINTHIIVTTADPLLAESLRDMIDLVLLKPVSYAQLTDMATRFL